MYTNQYGLLTNSWSCFGTCVQIYNSLIVMIKLVSVKKIWTSKSKFLATYDYSKKCIRREVRVYERYLVLCALGRSWGEVLALNLVWCFRQVTQGKCSGSIRNSTLTIAGIKITLISYCERRLKTMTHKELSITIFKQSPNLKNMLVHPRIPHPEENTKKELP